MSNKNRIVDIDLYNLLKECEIHTTIEDGQAVLYAIIELYNLQDFIKIVGPSYFSDDGGINVLLYDHYIVIRIDNIIEDVFEHNIEAYKDIIDDYNTYLDFKANHN